MSLLDDSVTQAKDGTWTFQCPGVQGDPCGQFSSNKWPTKKSAIARGAQHFAQHKDPTSPVQEMCDFIKDQGLVVNDDGSVSVKDL